MKPAPTGTSFSLIGDRGLESNSSPAPRRATGGAFTTLASPASPASSAPYPHPTTRVPTADPI